MNKCSSLSDTPKPTLEVVEMCYDTTMIGNEIHSVQWVQKQLKTVKSIQMELIRVYILNAAIIVGHSSIYISDVS